MWAPLYALPAGLSALAAHNTAHAASRVFRIIAIGVICTCVVMAALQAASLATVTSGVMNENVLKHEEGRELGGLLIVITWAGLTLVGGAGGGATPTTGAMAAMFLWLAAMLAVLPLVTWALCLHGDWRNSLGHCNNMFLG